jgi:erythronate-4-phosphate dehydrogenase
LLAPAPGAGFADWVLAAYDPRADHQRMGQALAANPDTGAAFDGLRKGYPWRRELGHFAPPVDADPALRRLLASAGFARP